MGRGNVPAYRGLAYVVIEDLALGRFGVGIGEAAGTPPSHSMISDYFPPERRATALSVYATGIYFGTGGGHVFVSADEGESWSAAAEFLPPVYSVTAAVV